MSGTLMMSCTVTNGQLPSTEASSIDVPWWSFGKTVLAATALTLVCDGLVDLDQPLPEGPFTLRQLLQHQAGLADYGELPEYHAAVARHESAWSVDELLQRLDATRLRYAPGTGWRYSNVGYLYVARLIERISGLSLEQALQQRALLPLGISHVRLASKRSDLPGTAASYDPDWVYHGLLIGPLPQAAIFLDRLLAGDLLPANLLEAMQSVYHLGGPIPGRPWQSPGYGLGVMQGPTADGLLLCGHTGGGPGSVVAVYQASRGDDSATAAVFVEGGSEGQVEKAVIEALLSALN